MQSFELTNQDDIADVIEALEISAYENLMSQCSPARIDAFIQHYGYRIDGVLVRGDSNYFEDGSFPNHTIEAFQIVVDGRDTDEIFDHYEEAVAYVLECIEEYHPAGELTETLLSLNIKK